MRSTGGVPRMTRFTIAVLPGDGIGPEVTAEAMRVLQAARRALRLRRSTRPSTPSARRRGARRAIRCRHATADAVTQADAVLLGAVGIPRSPRAEGRRRPEAGLLALRKLLGAYANLRPVTVHPAAAPRLAAPPRAAGRRGPADRAGAHRRALLRRARGRCERDTAVNTHAILGGRDRAGGAGRVRGGTGPAPAGARRWTRPTCWRCHSSGGRR